VGGIEDDASVGCWGVCVDAFVRVDDSGELFVGPGLTKEVMSSGVFAGVTLSMNCQAGRRRTMVEWSE
jgi:hypothetical protein